MTIYALLDYDGYICKAFWASHSKKGSDKNEYELLDTLTTSAIEKAADLFGVSVDEVKPVKVVSGHSWKKDCFSDYKAKRKRNEELGIFRDEIIANDGDIIKMEQLEADEIIILLKNYLDYRYCNNIIFSDDKDLRYYADLYCKINLAEEIEEVNFNDNIKNRYAQMLAGDKEDNITGIPKVGMVTASKLLDNVLSNREIKIPSLSDIIKIYKEKKVPYQDCIEQLALVIPVGTIDELSCQDEIDMLCESAINNEAHLLDDSIIQCIIEDTLNTIKDKVDLVYG